MLIIGIDEAGRGPVIGPMVMVGVLMDDVDEIMLKSLGVKDSKQLTQPQREKLYDSIKTIVKDFKVNIISPKEIDESVLGKGPKVNLNWLEANHIIEILSELSKFNESTKYNESKKKSTPEIAYIDCPSPNIKAYSEFLANGLAKNKVKIKLIVTHKADEKYISVSAASIIAKVIREHEVKRLKEKYKVDFGSGYPSDPKTQEFLKKNYSNPKYKDIFRESWSCYKDLAQAKLQRRLGEY
ncbi:ribonuclease HII [Candidatus Woesearchaeota archaeon]|nr:ribonuclease HII [Candidatus Woesearchaeota archaeon]